MKLLGQVTDEHWTMKWHAVLQFRNMAIANMLTYFELFLLMVSRCGIISCSMKKPFQVSSVTFRINMTHCKRKQIILYKQQLPTEWSLRVGMTCASLVMTTFVIYNTACHSLAHPWSLALIFYFCSSVDYHHWGMLQGCTPNLPTFWHHSFVFSQLKLSLLSLFLVCPRKFCG